MLQDLSIYDDELRDLEEQVQEYLDSMQKNPRGTTTEWYSRAQDKMKEINKLLHQFNIDVRVLSDSSEKSNYQRKARAHTETVTGLRQALNDMKKKFEQEGMSEGTGDEADGRVKARKIAKNVTDVQTSALQSLARSEALVADSERLGVESADTLRQQTEQIKLIGSQLDDLESNLGRARRELNAFTRRMMTDKLILAFIVLIFILLIVGVVLKFVKKAKGPQQQGPQ